MKTGLAETLERIAALIETRKKADPKTSYVAKLLSQGEDAVLKKIGEEATETVLAAKSGERLHLVREVAERRARRVAPPRGHLGTGRESRPQA